MEIDLPTPASAPTPLPPDTATRPSIFLNLNRTDSAPRELAWRQFYEHYAPVIFNYARQRGATAQKADEVVQNVISGFFEASPRFTYDPKRGRFRGYLKTCVNRALARMHKQRVGSDDGIPVEEIAVTDRADDEALWEQAWQQQLLRRAVETAREHYSRKGKIQTFRAFEELVLLGTSASDAAQKLGISITSVHTAKSRVTAKLKEIRAILQDEAG